MTTKTRLICFYVGWVLALVGGVCLGWEQGVQHAANHIRVAYIGQCASLGRYVAGNVHAHGGLCVVWSTPRDPAASVGDAAP